MDTRDLDTPPTDATTDAPPPLTVSGPDGRRVTVELANGRHTVGELAEALGVPRRTGVLIDGRPVDRRVLLVRSGAVDGSRITGRSNRVACRVERSLAGAAAAGRLVVTVEAGPAAGPMTALAPGRHVVGRAATCAVRLDDDLVELHHGVVDVATAADAAAMTFVQLAGRVPCRTSTGDGDAATPVHGTATLTTASVVIVGGSRLRLDPDRGDSVRPAGVAGAPAR